MTHNEEAGLLDRETKLLLEELSEVGENTRHYDKMMAQWCTVFLGLTIAILSWAISYFDRLALFALIGLAFFSQFSALVTLLIVLRLTFFKTLGLERAREIEQSLRFYYYSQIQEKRVRATDELGSKYTTTQIGLLTFVTFFVVWVVLIILKAGAVINGTDCVTSLANFLLFLS